VVRIIDHPGMAEAARRLVGRFGLSGFCGFDFILTETGEAQLLELNPRATPTCYLLVEGDFQRSRTIALFPADVIRGSDAGASTAGSSTCRGVHPRWCTGVRRCRPGSNARSGGPSAASPNASPDPRQPVRQPVRRS